MDQKTLKKMLTKAERRWREVLVARRKATEAENVYRKALQNWYEQEGKVVEPPKPLA